MKSKILELRKLGMLYKDIAREVGCSKGTVAYYCGTGQVEMNTKRQAAKRGKLRGWFLELKESLKCIRCDESRHWVLDFHHRDPTEKEASVSRVLRGGSKQRVLDEIAKCDVLCANCHRDEHYKLQVRK